MNRTAEGWRDLPRVNLDGDTLDAIEDIQEQAEELRLYREAWEKRCCAVTSHGSDNAPPGCLCLACIESRIADGKVRGMREGKV